MPCLLSRVAGATRPMPFEVRMKVSELPLGFVLRNVHAKQYNTAKC